MNTSDPATHAKVVSHADQLLARLREQLLGNARGRAVIKQAVDIAHALSESGNPALVVLGSAAMGVLLPIVSEMLEEGE